MREGDEGGRDLTKKLSESRHVTRSVICFTVLHGFTAALLHALDALYIH